MSYLKKCLWVQLVKLHDDIGVNLGPEGLGMMSSLVTATVVIG